MSTDEMKRAIEELWDHLGKQYVWEKTVQQSLDQLVEKDLLTRGPNVTDPPKPPR